jgi:hypothetical protein
MQVFNKWITINNKALNFEFSKVDIPLGDKYFVNNFDQQFQLTSFEVKEKEYGYWEIVLPAPQWILDIQDNIIRSIHEHIER